RIHLVCPETAVHFILSGKGTYNGQTLTAGDGFVSILGDLVDYAPDPEEPWTYLWFRIGGTDTEHLWENSLIPRQSTAFSCALPPGFLDAFRVFVSEIEDGYNEDRIRDEALAKLFFSFFQKPREKSDSSRMYVEYAKRQMADRIHQPITMEGLAERLHISRKYLSALFVRYEGIPPKQYLNRLRLERAAELLSSTSYSITDVACSVGFPDVLMFSRFFHTHTGMSPTEYRTAKNSIPKP
ncbi:MAG: AraC family transcriptional regulator, partial [Clostridia bacterium]|nr:AraC family transcriptional regulator [Clostridia bacterium]